MLKLAGQCDTKEWYISLAEQNWRIWTPREEIFFFRTGLSFDRKKLLAPPKKCPKNAYEHLNRFLTMKVKVGTFNQKKALVAAFSCL